MQNVNVGWGLSPIFVLNAAETAFHSLESISAELVEEGSL